MPTRDDDEPRVSPFPIPLSSAHIVEALGRSSDGGITLFLAKLGLSDIGADEAGELALAGKKGLKDANSVVERLALGNNRLTTLPTEFALLTHLRYLNLRHNTFSSFPDILTVMPSLDTLDISCNKIKRLPSHAGNLTQLRVFSISRNKITRLPTYLTQFQQLEVLQVERNPIEWPPRTVIESFGEVQDSSGGKDWVRKLQTWMENEGSKGREFDDSGYGERMEWEYENSSEPWRFPNRNASNTSGTPHARSFSIDSNVSSSSLLNMTYDSDTGKAKSTAKGRPTNLTTTFVDARKTTRPSVDLGEAAPTSAYSSSSYTASPTVLNPQEDSLLPEPEAMHLRTASHASSFRKPQSSSVTSKKSLPDLRTTHRDPKKTMPALPEKKSPNIIRPRDESDPSGSRQDSGSSSGSGLVVYGDDTGPSNPRLLALVAVERNAYFRRSSRPPANTSLPKSLQVLLESARSILFSMGQLFQTLEQFVHHGGNERLSSTFKKVLDPANVNMLHLIRSLDRFDDVSQKSMPSAAVCRALVESCRDTVTVFRKAVGLLGLQIGQEPADDVRYVRWLILELYAATAELSVAWQSMVPHIETLKPFLYGNTFLKTPSFSNGISDGGSHSPLSSEQLGSAVRLRPAEGSGSQVGTRMRTARRHAGSFSFKDVQVGKELPVFDLPLKVNGGVASQTPTLRTPKREITLPVVTTSTPNSSTYPFNAPGYFGSVSDSPYHQRHNSHNSLLDLMSPSRAQASPALNNPQNDREILRAVQSAIDIAPIVWDQLEEVLSEIQIPNEDLQESIEQARSVTKRLSDDIAIMSEGYSDADKRLLRENAHLFLKSLVHLSNILKVHGNPRIVSAALRSNMVQLTNSTEEFAILLHVSSISSYPVRSTSPTSTPKYAPYNATSYPIEDNQLLSSLSRSRSEQPTLTSSKLNLSSPYDSPRGTQPLSFTKNPNVRRLRLPREASNDSSDPG